MDERQEAKLEELLRGPNGASAFDSDDERRRAWNVNRDFVESLADRLQPGARPWAWWMYEVGRRVSRL